MGLGDFISGLFGSKNETVAATPKVDSNAYQYGGHAGGADAASNNLMFNANNAQNRQGAQADFSGSQPNYDLANRFNDQSIYARQAQGNAANLMYNRATGATPSIAQQQADRQMQQAAAAQGSQAASARGAAGVALAGQNAANNVANAQANISGQAQINAAQERQQAEQNAFGAYSGMRQGDQASQALASGQSQFTAGLDSGQQQFNAGLQQQQHGLNDTFQLGNQGQAIGVNTTQLGAGENQQSQQSANALGATGINAGVAGQNASINNSNAMGVIGLATGAGSSLVPGGGTPKATGGPVHAGRSYIVGDAPGDPGRPGGTEIFVPTAPPPMMAPRSVATWGTGPGATPEQGQRFAQQNAESIDAIDPGRLATHGPVTVASPIDVQRRRDEDTVARAKAYEAEGFQAHNDDDVAAKELEERSLRSANYRLGQDKKIAGKTPPAATAEPIAEKAKTSRLGDFLSGISSGALKQAAAVDTSYHGPGGGYIPPQLIGARAGGGPVDGGSPYLVGENGPELMVPPSDGVVIPAGPTQALLGGVPGGSGGADASASAYSGGGGVANPNPMGMYRHASAAGTAFSKNSGGAAMYGREEGGPVGAGDRVRVGEAGPELVMLAPRGNIASELRAGAAQDRQTIAQGGMVMPADNGQVPLGGVPEGMSLHQSFGADPHVWATHDAIAAATTPSASLSGDSGRQLKDLQQQSATRPPVPEESAPPPRAQPKKKPPRPMTPAEMLAAADLMMRQGAEEHAARMAQGPAVGFREEGGPVEAGKPYVAGEKGPEMVVTERPKSPHPLPAPPPSPEQAAAPTEAVGFMAVRPTEPKFRWEGSQLVRDNMPIAPPGPHSLPPPMPPPIQVAPLEPAGPPRPPTPPPAPMPKMSIADMVAALGQQGGRTSTGATHRAPARRRK